MNGQKNKISIPALIFFGAVDFILFVLAIPALFKLLGINTKTPIHGLLRGNEYISLFAFFAWIVFMFVFVFYIIIVSSGSASGRYKWTDFAEKIFQDLKMTFTKKSNIFGASYETAYYGLKTTCKMHMGGENSPNFVEIKLHHPQSLGLGLVIRSKGAASLASNEGKDIFAKTIKPQDPSLESVDIFMKKKEEFENTLYGAKISEPLRKLITILNNMGIKAGALDKFLGGLSGFYLNDTYVSVRIEEHFAKEENIESVKELIKSSAELSRALNLTLQVRAWH